MKVGGLFDGIGLLAYGLHRAGLQHAWLCEVDPWRRSILNQRFPGVPVFDDVRAVGAHNAEPVHVIAGGFPCKGASSAGKRNGFDHPETVLWREMFRIVGELRPRYVLIENVANLLALHGGAVWGEVLGDLAALGYDTTWDCLPAAAVGAPHLRDRVFAVATHADGPGELRDAGQRGKPHGRADAGGGNQVSADAGHGRLAQLSTEHGEEPARPYANPVGRGVSVEWGAYEPAVRRWEQLAGSAPEPLVRRVDDRRSGGVERSRLSALGDGVQVQCGELVGRHIIELERGRMTCPRCTKGTWVDSNGTARRCYACRGTGVIAALAPTAASSPFLSSGDPE